MGDTYMTSMLKGVVGREGGGGDTKMRCYGGLVSVLDAQYLIFLLKKIGYCGVTWHHAEPNNILLTRNLPFDPDARHWSHPLMIPLHCSWPKSNNRTRGQFECDVTWFCRWACNDAHVFSEGKPCFMFWSLIITAILVMFQFI